MTAMDIDLSYAVIDYLGWGSHPDPRTDRDRVEATYGSVVARAVEALILEVTMVPMDWSRQTLVQAEADVQAEMGRRHPRLDQRALAALAWRFAYDWR